MFNVHKKITKLGHEFLTTENYANWQVHDCMNQNDNHGEIINSSKGNWITTSVEIKTPPMQYAKDATSNKVTESLDSQPQVNGLVFFHPSPPRTRLNHRLCRMRISCVANHDWQPSPNPSKYIRSESLYHNAVSILFVDGPIEISRRAECSIERFSRRLTSRMAWHSRKRSPSRSSLLLCCWCNLHGRTLLKQKIGTRCGGQRGG